MFKKPKGGTGGGGLFGLLKTGGKIAIAVEVACFGVLYCGYRYISGTTTLCTTYPPYVLKTGKFEGCLTKDTLIVGFTRIAVHIFQYFQSFLFGSIWTISKHGSHIRGET